METGVKKDEGRKVRGTSRQEEPDIAVGGGGPATGRFVSNCSRVSRENTDVQNVLEVEVGETDGEGKGNESWLCTGECRAGPWGPGGDRWAVGLSEGARQCEGQGTPQVRHGRASGEEHSTGVFLRFVAQGQTAS